MKKNTTSFLLVERQENKYIGRKMEIDNKRNTNISKMEFEVTSGDKDIKALLRQKNINNAIIRTIRNSEADYGKWGIINENSLAIIPKTLVRKVNETANKNFKKWEQENHSSMITTDDEILLLRYFCYLMRKGGSINSELNELLYCLYNNSQPTQPFDINRRTDEFVNRILKEKDIQKIYQKKI